MNDRKTWVCKNCGELPASDFYKHSLRGYQNVCKDCSAKNSKKRYSDGVTKRGLSYKEARKKNASALKERNRKLVIEHLKLNKCCVCGEDDIVVLEFHHNDPQRKRFNIAQFSTYSKETIMMEIDKCVVMCANCHRRVTAKENGWAKCV